jgi:hypothetical protein
MSPVIVSRTAALLLATAVFFLLQLPHSHAQWWKRAPADFEECADLAEKSPTKEQKTAALASCNSKFAGRRKPGGGYAYFDFLQNRTFDIAGPNPTPEEQKKIDESYAAYLAEQRRSKAAAEAAVQQRQQRERELSEQREREQQRERIEQVSLRSSIESAPPPVQHAKQQPTPTKSGVRARPKTRHCGKGSFSCQFPKLSNGLNGLKRILRFP